MSAIAVPGTHQVERGSRPSNLKPVAVSGVLIVLGALHLGSVFAWTHAALFLVGVAAGVVLYHAAFGFTSAWGALLSGARGEGLRAQMVMLAVTCAAFIPVLAAGQLFGHPVRGSVAPFGVSVAAGAFLFGIGMQLGGGCASGTLYTVGGGNVRMLLTLASFIVGSVLGVLHMPTWERAPSLGSLSLVSAFGGLGALGFSLLLFGAVAALSLVVERRRHGQDAPFLSWPGTRSWLRGPWPLVAGALGLALVNIATLAFAGRPWGVTSAFALWGSKALAATGVDVGSWPYWRVSARAATLRAGVLSDVTSIMNIGIMLGSLAASGLAGRFSPTWRVPARSAAAAVVGGLLLGYGSRISYGCNIGAYFSGIASTSLHGWLWFAAALAGNAAGRKLRPLFGLTA